MIPGNIPFFFAVTMGMSINTTMLRRDLHPQDPPGHQHHISRHDLSLQKASLDLFDARTASEYEDIAILNRIESGDSEGWKHAENPPQPHANWDTTEVLRRWEDITPPDDWGSAKFETIEESEEDIFPEVPDNTATIRHHHLSGVSSHMGLPNPSIPSSAQAKQEELQAFLKELVEDRNFYLSFEAYRNEIYNIDSTAENLISNLVFFDNFSRVRLEAFELETVRQRARLEAMATFDKSLWRDRKEMRRLDELMDKNFKLVKILEDFLDKKRDEDRDIERVDINYSDDTYE
ncbi:hypothetical protein JCM33374_g5610 [Metschnikowia sp. JCM 33374]|nr:hypothetical protein JCM33374_g5610 [Metschnikowia sp. JCM 33374]